MIDRLIVLDLDGTLAESKAPIDIEAAELLTKLLTVTSVAIMSGGDWPQFERQVLSVLRPATNLSALSLLPTCGTKFYAHREGWTSINSEDLTEAEKRTITEALGNAVESTGLTAARTWGPQIEDRGTQITSSALGQTAPLIEKQRWDPNFEKRAVMKTVLEGILPAFSVRLGGTTSIDITKAGVDKGYGIRKLRDTLTIPISRMIFVGDALFPGGNDYPAKEAGATSIRVRDPDETKRVIETVIACLADVDSTESGS